MRILVVNDDFPPEGQSSVAHVASDLVETYRRKGHDVHVLTSHRVATSSDIIRTEGLTSLPVSYRTSLRHHHMLGTPAVSRMLEAEMCRIAPDAIHAHNIHGYLTFDVLRIGGRLAPTVFTAHDVMAIAYGRLATERYLSSKGANTRLSLADHMRTAGLQYNPIRNLSLRSILRRGAHAVVTPSTALAEAFATNGIPGATVIPNGIDADAWYDGGMATRDHLQASMGIGNRPVILFGGRLSKDKGAIPLLEALRRTARTVPNVLLLVIGDEGKWEKLMHEAQAEDLRDRVRCTGWLPHKQLPGIYALSTVVTTPSLCLDVFPTVNMEAMAAGKPVVGTIFGGTPEIVEDGKTGFVVDPRDTDTYASHLTSLLTDAALAASMGEAGRKRVRTDFTLEAQADRYLALFDRARS